MYNQTYNGGATYGVGYGAEYTQQHQHYYYQQQQHTQQQQQMIAGIMGYYPSEAAAMFYNPYSYGQPTARQQFAQQQAQLDYQLTPALYLLNQQAELLQKSLVKAPLSKKSGETGKPQPVQRKQRGPYKRRTNKTLSPTVSPAPEFVTDAAERLSSSDLAGSNNRSVGTPISIDLTGSSNNTTSTTDSVQQQTQRKRKSDSFLELEQQQTNKHSRTLLNQRKQSIFRDVALMAVSSCTNNTTQSETSSC
uniref:Uncharacterized protein n=1 Tax=Anopheles epiroticus TaxID=199890 RepID=A0A182PCZ2_9DIPT